MNSEKVIEEAFDQNNFFEILTGQDRLVFINPYANTPTDFSHVFNLLENYYNQHIQDFVWDKFLTVLVQLCREPIYIWIVPYYVSNYLRFKLNSNYKITDHSELDAIKVEFNNGITKFSESLKNNHDWMGDNMVDGLYGDIIRMNRSIQDRFNYSLILTSF